jgi:hypothetical protein
MYVPLTFSSQDVDEQQRKHRSYQESLNKLSSLVQHDHQTPGRVSKSIF